MDAPRRPRLVLQSDRAKRGSGERETEFREIHRIRSILEKHATQTRRYHHIAEADDRLSCGGDGADFCWHTCAGPSRAPRSAYALFPKYVCLVAPGRSLI